MKASCTKADLKILDTEELKKLRKWISEELSKRNKKEREKLGTGLNPSKDHLYTTLVTDDERARYRRVGYDSERF